MAELRQTIIHGYGDRLSVAPGERIEFKVSSEEPGTFRADVVRLIHGDTNPAGPSFKEEVIETGASGDIVPISGEATVERTVAGPAGDAGTAFTIAGLSREPGSAWVDSHLNGKVESPSVWDGRHDRYECALLHSTNCYVEHAVKHLTIRNLPPDLADALTREKHRRDRSLNQTVIDLLAQSLGLSASSRRSNGLADLAGTWSEDELAAFEAAVKSTEELDEELWR